MGRKSKASENGLTPLIVEKWDGGKNTIVYVTDEVNEWLTSNGYKVTLSRESIRRVIKSHEEEVVYAKRGMEAARAIAEVLKDYPATEQSEVTLLQVGQLIAADLRSVDSIQFENPEAMVSSIVKVAEAQMKLSNYRTKAIKALEKAKGQIKQELQAEIKSDPELLERLVAIVDSIEVK